MKRVNLAVLSGICVAALAMEARALPLILSWSDSGSDVAITNGPTTQLENMKGYNGNPGAVVPFNEDVPAYEDRTHQYNGPRFTAAGVLSTTATDTAKGLPGYLIGGEYMSTMQSNRDNTAYRMIVNTGPAVQAYLLLDNRLGNTVNTNPPTLGSGGAGLMAWVADDGWARLNTGYSPNGQPDFVAVDEGATITDFNTRPTNVSGLGVGAGNDIQNFYTVYTKLFPAGSTITLKEQNGGGINMYGLVVTAPLVPEPTSLLGLSALAALGFMRRRRA